MFHYCLPLERRTVWPLIKQLIFAKFHWKLPHSLWNIQECKMVIDRWSEKAERIPPDNGWSEKIITWIFCFGDPKAHTIYLHQMSRESEYLPFHHLLQLRYTVRLGSTTDNLCYWSDLAASARTSHSAIPRPEAGPIQNKPVQSSLLFCWRPQRILSDLRCCIK